MNDHLKPFQQFIDKAVSAMKNDPEAIGLAVGGSWITNGMDAFSDLDLVVVTARPIAPDGAAMQTYADRFGPVLSSFVGHHVGEPRLLIALFDAPLLHVDIKFLTLPEFYQRVEDPVVVWERDQLLTGVIGASVAVYPPFDFQGTEDRFWVWIHYALLKIGRGEYVEVVDFLAFIRTSVLGPMLHLKNGGLPRGVRRIETTVSADDLNRLRMTVATPAFRPLMESMAVTMQLYKDVLDLLAPATLHRRDQAQQAVRAYYEQILMINQP